MRGCGPPAASCRRLRWLPPPLAGTPFGLLTVQDLSLAQLQSLHLGGRRGARVPTLQQFLG
jgi:hypothetical protein